MRFYTIKNLCQHRFASVNLIAFSPLAEDLTIAIGHIPRIVLIQPYLYLIAGCKSDHLIVDLNRSIHLINRLVTYQRFIEYQRALLLRNKRLL
jgi:hypothetical protein